MNPEKHSSRIATLRTEHLARNTMQERPVWDMDPRVMLDSLEASEDESSWAVRRGCLTHDLLATFRFHISEHDLMAGAPLNREELLCPEWDRAQKKLREKYGFVYTPGQTGHCELDMDRLYAMGIDGLCADLESRKAKAAGQEAETLESFLLAVKGFGRMLEHAGDTAEQKMAEAAPENRKRLQAIAESCHRVAHEPPASFLDALHLLWMSFVACKVGDSAALVGPGHLDRILLPFYEADLQAGRIDSDDALAMIENLYIHINNFVPPGLAVAVMVGGRDASGANVTNELSYLSLEALRRTKLVYPTVGICWHADTPKDLTRLGVDLIADGYSNVAFFGDETIQRGLQMYGVSPEESHYYINSTCVEITPSGSSNIWVASPYYPVCAYLRDEIEEEVREGRPAQNFDELMRNYRKRLSAKIAEGVAGINRNRKTRQQNGGKPFQSVLTKDCIERARDIDNGGARYNWAECSFVGLANLADALYVVREEVFEKQNISLEELWKMLEADFEGYEAERRRFANAYPKYGNDVGEVDHLVAGMVEVIREECAKHSIEPDDSPYVPGAFCWIQHERLGAACGATPDGRRSGFAFADGCGGAQGREMNGPTAAILSVTSWDSSPLIGGVALNMKFNKSLFTTAKSREQLEALMVTYLKRGGFEVQINMLDPDVLQRAKENPEAYQDLVVRIGGYTDYFTRLSPEMQAEVMQRTEYNSLS